MTVQRILSQKDKTLIRVAPDTPVREVVGVLHGKGVGAVLVMEGDTLIGVVSERSVVRAMAQNPDGVRAMPARMVMRPLEVDIQPTASVEDAMEKMTRHRVRYLPVIEDGQVVGILSIGDVVKDQLGERARTVESLTNYIAGN